MIKFPINLAADSVSEFYHRLEQIIALQAAEAIEVDCSNIERVTSSHINVLWQARLLCSETDMELKVVSPTADLIRVLKALDLYEVFVDDQWFPEGWDESTGGFNILDRNRELGLKFKADSQSIDDALSAFRRYLKELNISGTSAFELETAFYEVATNIRLHGRLDVEDQVEFKAACLPDRLSMKFIDPGRPFNFNSSRRDFDPIRAMGEQKKRGFGLIMISRMTDDVHYERKDDRLNVLTLEKMWSGLNG